MSLLTIGNKVAGVIFILFGTLLIFYLFYSKRLILDNYSFFLARYFKVILAAYGGLVFILFGILHLVGLLVPYYKANTYEKAKGNILSSIFTLPLFSFLLIVTSVSFNNNEIIAYKILGIIFSAIMILCCLWSFYYSMNNLKKFHKKPKERKGTVM